MNAVAGATIAARVACGRASDRTIVVVTHVSPIKAAVAWAVGGTDEMAWRMFVAPASITRIATSVGAPSLHTFNDCSHLTG